MKISYASLLLVLAFASKAAYSLDEARLEFLKAKKKSERSYPNCHNATLYLKNIAQGIRYTSDSEMKAALKAYCKTLRAEEPSRRGDVGVVISPDNDLLHSFIFLDNKTFFSKTSYNSFFPYETISLEGLIYSGAKGSCDGCDNEIIRYRCHLKPTPFTLSSELEKLELSFQVYALAKSEDFYPNPEQLQYLNTLKLRSSKLLTKIEELKFENSLEREFFVQSLKSLEYNADRWIEPDDDD